MNWWKFVGSVTVGILAGMFLASRTAHAHMFNQSDCISLANDAVTFAERHRDSPATHDHDWIVLNLIATQSMGSEGSYIKDEQDKQTILKVFNEVMKSDWTPGQAYDHEYDSCMKKVEPILPKGEKRSGAQVES